MCAKRDRKPGFDSEFDGCELKIKLRGEIDHHSAVAVRTNIDDMIRSRRPSLLILDMSAVDFMDSSGLGLIMGRYTAMQSVGGEMCVLDPSPAAERIMSLAGMERIVAVRRSADAQSAAVGQRMDRAIKKRSECHKRRRGEAAVSQKDGEGNGVK